MIVWGHDRTEAIARTKRALEEFRVFGLKTTIGFHRVVMDNAKFVKGDLSTRFLEEEYPDNKYTVLDNDTREHAAIVAALDTFIKERHIAVASSSDGKSDDGASTLSPWVAFHRRGGLRTFQGSGS